MFELLYQGIDTLDIAFQGALRPDVMEHLKAARAEAEEQDEPQLITFGPGQVEAHLSPFGRKGGYRFVLDNGPEGAQWLFKANLSRDGWNGFVSPKSGMLLTRSLEDAQREIWETLERMGFEVTGHAVNRIDYAMDFATDHFEPNPEQFVAHSNCKAKPYYGDKEIDDTLPSPVTRGRRVETVTIGKMPGRQIIVYDKRRDSIVKQKLWWFPVWGISKDDRSREIWRVEIRAGKKELKDKWNLRTIEELQSSLGDLLQRSLQDVRYVDTGQSDSNVTRQELHAIWIAAMRTPLDVESFGNTGLLPGAIKEVEREKAVEISKSLMLGNAIRMAVADGWTDNEVLELLPDLVRKELAETLSNRKTKIFRKIHKVRDQIAFLRN